MKKRRGGRKSAPKPPVYRSPIAGILDELGDDLLERILGQCEPCDLLAVARASKRCYAFVMREDRGLFEATFERIGEEYGPVPTRPEGMTLPQWTALIWPQSCTVRTCWRCRCS